MAFKKYTRMKTIKKILLSCSLLAVAALPSCKKYLDEEMVATLTNAHYETVEGLESLVAGMYDGLRFHFMYEWAYTTTNYGTDEFTNGVVWIRSLLTRIPQLSIHVQLNLPMFGIICMLISMLLILA